MTKKWVTCSKCGKLDVTVKGHVGTSNKMQCSDCDAKLCRNCCPTGHGTKWQEA